MESAKILNAKVLADNAAINAKIDGFITLQPQWNKSWTVDGNNGIEYIAVPTVESYVENRSVSIRRLLVFDTKNGNLKSGRVIEFIGLNYAITPKLDNLIKNYSNIAIDGFNGAIIQYSLDYKLLGGALYEKGTKTGNVSLLRSATGKEVYLSRYNMDMEGKRSIGEQSLLFANSNLRTLSDEGTGSLGGTQSLSGVTIYSGPSGPNPFYGGNTNPPDISVIGSYTPPDITNALTGCNKIIVNALLNTNFEGKISFILQSIFNQTGQINLVFVEGDTYMDAPAQTIITQNNTVFTVTTTVNPRKMPSDASMEYRASIIIHEIVHAYLLQQGTDLNSQVRQHQDIAHDYIGDIALALQQAFGTPEDQARSLAFGGMKDYMQAYPNDWNNILSQFQLNSSTAMFNIEAHRQGLMGYGTKCAN